MNLTAAFAEFDALTADRMAAWGLERKAAVAALRKELQDQRRAMGEWEYYARLFAVAGGKTWFGKFDGRSADDVERMMRHTAKMNAEARNAKIAAKLAKLGITELGELTFGRTQDGFQGVFSFEGATVRIQVIGAGGYNIQCYHERVLIYVNEKKI